MIILQSESKMKAALGQKVKVSLPEAFQINKAHTKSLIVKGVPTRWKNFANLFQSCSASPAKVSVIQPKTVG